MNPFILALFLATPCTALVTVEKAISFAHFIGDSQTDLRYGSVTYGITQNELNSLLYNFTKLMITKDLYSRLFHFGTNDQCKLQLSSILNGLKNGARWSYSWLDASGKIPAGVTGGAFLWTGSLEVCRRSVGFSVETNDSFWGQYCSIHFQLGPASGINYGICVPEACNKRDLIDMIKSVPLPLKPMANMSECHKKENELPKDNWYYCALYLLAVVLAFVVVGSLTEMKLFVLWWRYKNGELEDLECSERINKEGIREIAAEPNRSPADTIIQNNMIEEFPVVNRMNYLHYRELRLKSSTILTMLCAYSAPFNVWKICTARGPTVILADGTEREHPLTCLDGIRLITMMWIIFGHLLLFLLYTSNNVYLFMDMVLKSPSFMIIMSGTLSVDTFFLMSGLLTTYLTLTRYRPKFGSKSWAKFWSLFVLHRIIRLTPAYLFVLVLYIGLIFHIRDGPMFPQDLDLMDYSMCRRTWYLIYLNNLVKTDQICMAWSWYLANDMQFTLVLAPIFITLVSWKRVAGVLFATALIISGTATTMVLTYIHQFPLLPMDTNWMTVVYMRPYTRWGTYVIGMLLGWILVDFPQMTKPRSKLCQYGVSIGGVLLAALLTLLPIYGPYRVSSGELPPFTRLQSAAYHGLSRPSFTLGVAIVVFLCATGYLEPVRAFLAWSAFRAGARLTYCAYLLHPIILNYVYMGAKTPFVVDKTLMTVEFIGTFILTYFLSLVLSLLAESPMLTLERRLRRLR